ncbi:MAG: hypothetical protein IJ121_01275 [Eubacterium sp.]|nr:hypothetical protein [Eubacterium sp.]
MIAFEIDQVKLFMSRLLLSDAFDHFLVPEVSITTYATFRIDGTLHPAFYGDISDESEAPSGAAVPGSALQNNTGGNSAAKKIRSHSAGSKDDAAGMRTGNADRAGGRYVRWAELKNHCLAIIRGKRTPLAFHFVFQYPEDAATNLILQESLPVAPEDVHGLYFNCRFQEGRLLITSGTSLAVFDIQKAVERAWDAQLSRFLTRLELL